MEIILHKVNTLKELEQTPKIYGTEIDVRAFKNKLILNHDPYRNGDLLEKYLKKYKHGTLIVNIKESGIELDVIKLLKKYNINDYFLLDIEFPFVLKAIKLKNKNISIRLSKLETVKNLNDFKNKVKWIWIDTYFSYLPKKKFFTNLKGYKVCIVCPERWGKPSLIKRFKKYIEKNNIKIDAVMANKKYLKLWES